MADASLAMLIYFCSSWTYFNVIYYDELDLSTYNILWVLVVILLLFIPLCDLCIFFFGKVLENQENHFLFAKRFQTDSDSPG